MPFWRTVVPFPNISLDKLSTRLKVPSLVTVPEILARLEVKLPLFTIVRSCPIEALFVTVPVIWVVPLPLTVWDRVPSLRVNVPWLDTAPPMLSALAVSNLSALTAIAWLINELAVTSPAITVEPLPLIYQRWLL